MRKFRSFIEDSFTENGIEGGFVKGKVVEIIGLDVKPEYIEPIKALKEAKKIEKENKKKKKID